MSDKRTIKLILFLILAVILNNVCKSQNIVIGSLLYERGYDFKPNEITTIGYLNTYLTVNVDSLSDKDVVRMLTLAGIEPSRIKCAKGYGSATSNTIEIFFAYEGKILKPVEDVTEYNNHHRYSGEAYQNKLLVPQFKNINQGLDSIILRVAKDYTLYSFMVKPFNMPELPFLVLAKNPINGTLADMRYIANSNRLVPYFKDLNFQIIHYNENGTAKVLFRPKTGWPK